MSSIGGAGGPGSGAPIKPGDLPSGQGAPRGVDTQQKAVVDSFQRAGAQLQAKLESLSGPALAQRISFSNEQLAVLARTVAGIIQQNPGADRKDRAKLFAKAILKKKGMQKRGRLAHLLDDENEEHSDQDRRALETLYEMVADQLDATPVFAQLVDEVTESVRKIR
jgi:hypothetical protein